MLTLPREIVPMVGRRSLVLLLLVDLPIIILVVSQLISVLIVFHIVECVDDNRYSKGDHGWILSWFSWF